ncbi:MAG: metallophosphoesterase [Planctomycetota bacterium]
MIRKADIVKSYLREHPDTGNRTIAEYLFKRYPGVWQTVNAAQCSVRYYRGANGPKNRKHRQGLEQFPRIPAADVTTSPLMKLTTPGKWLVVGDLHVPYHDATAIEAAFRYGIEQGCEHLLVNGDALDAYQVSRWVRNPNQRRLDDEIALLKQLLAEVSPHFAGQKVYKIGNHEERIETYLFENAPKMIGASQWDLRKVLKEHLSLDDWTMIGSKQLFRLGKLHGYHGHELPRGLTNPVSVGRGVWLRTKQSGFTNHWHSTSTHVESSGSKDKTWVCFSVGCLCNLHPDYAPINGWNHGFAIIDLEKGGSYSESNHRIVNGEVW